MYTVLGCNMNQGNESGSDGAAAFVYADDRARAAAERYAYVARVLRESEAYELAFVDDVSYEFLVAKNIGNYSMMLLVQWQLAEMIHLNARYCNALQRKGLKRRVGALSFPNGREVLKRRLASAKLWHAQLLAELEKYQAAAWSVARTKGSDAMKRRIATLREKIEAEIGQRERDGPLNDSGKIRRVTTCSICEHSSAHLL